MNGRDTIAQNYITIGHKDRKVGNCDVSTGHSDGIIRCWWNKRKL